MHLRRIAIVGGGIGGMVAALCLARAGFDVDVYERADSISEVGAGIQLSPNCTGVLHALGLEPQLHRIGSIPEAIEIRHFRTSRLLSRSVLGDRAVEEYGSPYYHVHRADLIDALVHRAAMDPRIRIHTRADVECIELLDNGARFEVDGKRIDADVLIGADGIHSTVRGAIFGADDARFTGNVAWRALVPASRLPACFGDGFTCLWWGPGRHFVHYPVRGGDYLNCVGVVTKAGWQTESWTEPGEKRELVSDFAGWHESLTGIIELIDDETIFKWALFDRPSMPSWTRGNVTLLGDACHATLPFMAQGAAMAIEDAAVLARMLVKSDSVPQALSAYESARIERTARVQRASRRNATIYHLWGLPAWIRDRVAQRAGDSIMDWLYGYDPLSQV